MKIARVSFMGVLGVPDGQLELGDARGCAPFVLTGPIGSGKTRALEAIIAAKEHLGAYGLPPRAEAWRSPRVPGRIEVDLVLDTEERARLELAEPSVRGTFDLAPGESPARLPVRVARLVSLWDRSPTTSKLEYFHAGRMADCDSWTSSDSSLAIASARLTRARGKYGWVRSMLEGSSRAAAARTVDQLIERGIVVGVPEGLEGFASRLEKLTDRLRWLRVRESVDGARCCFARAGGGEVELNDLSDGERAVVLFAAAFEQLGLERSVVLIDTPELMLHPEEHVRVFEGLASMLTHGQLIVATTSPAILRTVPSSRVWVLPGVPPRALD